MTNLTDVTQADREAAAELLAGAAPEGLREGRQDSLSLVRAFARHRLTPRQDGLREAAQAVLDNADRPGSRMHFESGPKGEDVWIDHKEVDQPVLDQLAAALSDTSPLANEVTK